MIPLAEQFKPLHKEKHEPMSEFLRQQKIKAYWREIGRILSDQFDLSQWIENGYPRNQYIVNKNYNKYQNHEDHDFYSEKHLKQRYSYNRIRIADIESDLNKLVGG